MAASLVDSNWCSMGMVLLLLGNNSQKVMRKASNSIHIGSQTILYSLDATLCHVIRNPYTIHLQRHSLHWDHSRNSHQVNHNRTNKDHKDYCIDFPCGYYRCDTRVLCCSRNRDIEEEKEREKRPAEHVIRDWEESKSPLTYHIHRLIWYFEKGKRAL